MVSTLTFLGLALPAVFSLHPKNHSVAIGGTVTLTCAARETKQPIQWLKDNQTIAKTTPGGQGTVQLLLNNITEKDYGIYQCMVENLHGPAVYSGKAFVMRPGGWYTTHVKLLLRVITVEPAVQRFTCESEAFGSSF